MAENSSKLVELLEVSGLSLPLESNALREVARIIGATHDVGKATKYFQEYLPPSSKKPINQMLKAHSLLSALYGHFATKEVFANSHFSDVVASYVSLAIRAHHGGLDSPTITASKVFAARDVLTEQIEAIERMDELDTIVQDAHLPKFSEFSLRLKSEIMSYLKTANVLPREAGRLFGKGLAPFYLLNILFSVLIDADRMDAAALSFPTRQEISVQNVEEYVSTLSRTSRLDGKANQRVADGRDELFRILSHKAAVVPLRRHIFSVTAPTGYGKTLACLHFAMKLRERLARNGGLSRIIYVAPYLSILDQNFESIAQALGVAQTQSDVLLLHHHLAGIQYESADLSKETFTTLNSELLIEGWNAEVVVTSFIQFFYALIGSRASQLRKLHNLTGAIVILDEVQTLPYEYWGLVKETMKFVTDKLGMYVILMTATQPLIFSKDDLTELAEDLSSDSWAPRVAIKSWIKKDVGLLEFIKEVNRSLKEVHGKSILIVMNTIDSSVRVFHGLKTDLERYYLSANVVPAHRKKRINEIAKHLERREPLVLVSTQVIEAGVDLDFDTVIRDIGPVDSIIQVAGRCNRNGLRRPQESKVYLYSVVDDTTQARYANRIYGNYLIDRSMEVLSTSAGLDPFRLARQYYLAIRRGASDLESRDLLDSMSELDYGKLTDFKLIDSQPNFSVYVDVDDGAARIWDEYVRICESTRHGLSRKQEFLRIRSEFYSYVVNVPSRSVSNLDQDRGFYRIPRNKIGVLYDRDTGFVSDTQKDPWKNEKAWID